MFGSAVHEGQPRTGTELAPRALREGGLLSALYNLDWQVHDHGDVAAKNFKIQLHKTHFFRNSDILG